MCIIVYKPQSITMPKNSILKNCFDSNPDGAGFMYQDNNSEQVIIQKGYMDYYSFFDAITELNNSINITAADIVFHFRYATQGSISSVNCHPFPISKKIKDLKECSITTRVAMVHNGVIPFCSDYNNKNKLSDTQIFIKDYLSKMNNSTLFNPAVLALIEESTNSKFIFMSAKQIEIVGNFIEDHGLYYSNDTYKNSRWITKLPKKYYQVKSIIDCCAGCNQYSYITDEYNWLCTDCEELFKYSLNIK